MNKIKSITTVVLLVFNVSLLFSQVRVSEIIKSSDLIQTEKNSLYFVDFWATWCKPCIHVSKYLESLQQQYPNDFYILSLSQESPGVVKKFLKKHDLKLAVGIDYEGETFNKYNIYSLPQGILFNAKGEKLWEGHPAEFKSYHLEGYLSQHKSKATVQDFFKVTAYSEELPQRKATIKKDFEYEVIGDFDVYNSFQNINEALYEELNGNLQDILAYALGIYKNQVEIPESLNKNYTMRFKKDSKAYLNKIDVILKALKLKRVKTEKEGEMLLFKLNSPNFWDVNQIDWEGNSQNYLVGDSEIQADNVSLQDMVYKLSNVMEIPIVLDAAYQNSDLHDWQIHYKYFELMTSNLEDYGVVVKKKVAKYPQYIINKKAL